MVLRLAALRMFLEDIFRFFRRRKETRLKLNKLKTLRMILGQG